MRKKYSSLNNKNTIFVILPVIIVFSILTFFFLSYKRNMSTNENYVEVKPVLAQTQNKKNKMTISASSDGVTGFDFKNVKYTAATNAIRADRVSKDGTNYIYVPDTQATRQSDKHVFTTYCIDPILPEAIGEYEIMSGVDFSQSELNSFYKALTGGYGEYAITTAVRSLLVSGIGATYCPTEGNKPTYNPDGTVKHSGENKDGTCRFWRGVCESGSGCGWGNTDYSLSPFSSINVLKDSYRSAVLAIRAAGSETGELVNPSSFTKSLNKNIDVEKECKGGECTVTFVLEEQYPKYYTMQNPIHDSKYISSFTCTKEETSNANDNVKCSLKFKEADLNSIVKENIEVNMKFTGGSTVFLIKTTGSTNLQRLLVLDNTPKELKFKFKLDLEGFDCEDIVGQNEQTIINAQDDTAFANVLKIFEDNGKKLSKENLDSEDNCCTQIKDKNGNLYNKYCSSCDDLIKDKDNKKILAKTNNGEGYEESKKIFTDAGMTLSRETIKNDNDCCLNIKDSYGKLYNKYCSNCDDILSANAGKIVGLGKNKDKFDEFTKKMFDGTEFYFSKDNQDDPKNCCVPELEKVNNKVYFNFNCKDRECDIIIEEHEDDLKKAEEKDSETVKGYFTIEGYTLDKDPKVEKNCCDQLEGKVDDKVYKKLCKDSTCDLIIEDNKDFLSNAKVDDKESVKKVFTDKKYTLDPDPEVEKNCCDDVEGTLNKDLYKALCKDSTCSDLVIEVNNEKSLSSYTDASSVKNAFKAKNSEVYFSKKDQTDPKNCCLQIKGKVTTKVYNALCETEDKTCDEVIKELGDSIATYTGPGLTGVFAAYNKYLSANDKDDPDNCCNLIQGKVKQEVYKEKCEEPDDEPECTTEPCNKEFDCEKVGFKLECTPEIMGSTTETFEVKEAFINGKDKYSECVVDVARYDRLYKNGQKNNQTAKQNMSKFVDAAKSSNPYEYSKAKSNRYCSISCSERWEYQFASFENFTGKDHAIKAGSYFAMDKDLYIKGSRTCLTTYIDYQTYYTNVRELSNKMTVAWNVLLEFLDAYQYAVDTRNKYDYAEEEENPQKETMCSKLTNESRDPYVYCCEKWVQKTVTYDNGSTGTVSECVEAPSTCYAAVCKEEKECPRYTIHVQKSSNDQTVKHFYEFEKLLNKDPDSSEGYGKNKDDKTNTHERYLNFAITDTVRSAAPEQCCQEEKYEIGETGKPLSSYDLGQSRKEDWQCQYLDDSEINNNKEKAWAKKIKDLEYHSASEKWTSTSGYDAADKHTGIEDGDSYGPGGNVIQTIKRTLKDIGIFKEEIDERVKDMAYCQNFYMSNDEEQYRNLSFDSTIKNYNAGKTEDFAGDAINLYKNPQNYVYKSDKYTSYSYAPLNPKSGDTKISTTYNPYGIYTYDEKDYMNMVAEKNHLIDNIQRNDGVYGTSSVIFNTKRKVSKSATDKAIYYNKIDTFAYDVGDNQPWENASQAGHDYKGGSAKAIATCDDGKEGPDCIGIDKSSVKTVKSFMNICVASAFTEPDYYSHQDVIFNIGENFDCDPEITFYYYKANYIKQTLTNSTYLVNYGNFYYYGAHEEIVFGRDMEDAVSRSKVDNKKERDGSGGYKNWSILASQNVFPVSSTTSRGIYSYTYKFWNMGNYNNDDKLGRVIGGKNPVTEFTRKDNGTDMIVDADLGSGNRWCQYEVYETLCACCGYPIETNYKIFFGNDDIKSHETFKSKSKSQRTKSEETGGKMLYYPTTVSLYDLEAVGNWGDTSYLLYNGDNYRISNDKGGQLTAAIKEVGENIYDKVPEYAYRLKPEDLSKIIQYNSSQNDSYQIKMDNLIVSDGTYISGEHNEESGPRFYHYESKFLQNEIKDAEHIKSDADGNETSTDVLLTHRHDVCTVESYDRAKLENIATSRNSCKWWDFCGTNATAVDPNTEQQTISYCLAFK